MKFKDVAGHEREKRILRDMVRQSKIPHAVLLHGPSGIGKTNLARAFIQYINCSNSTDNDSCGTCPECLRTSNLNNPDIHYVYPVLKRSNPSRSISEDYATEWAKMLESNSLMPYGEWLDIIEAGNSQPLIYVVESDEILRIASLSSYASKYKVFLIWLPEKLHPDAANKLLKVIEEPHEDTLFVLVSNDPGNILPTIKSRLTPIELGQLSSREIYDWIIANNIEPGEAEKIARIAKGNLITASCLLETHGEASDFRSFFIDVMRNCYARNMKELRNLSDKAASEGREKSLRLLDYFGRMIRESYISNLKIDSLNAMTEEERKFTLKFAPFIHSGNVEKMGEEISRARIDISRNANQKIVWFDLMLQFMILLHSK